MTSPSGRGQPAPPRRHRTRAAGGTPRSARAGRRCRRPWPSSPRPCRAVRPSGSAALLTALSEAVAVAGADAGPHVVVWPNRVPRAQEDALVARTHAAELGVSPVGPLYAPAPAAGLPETAGSVAGYASLGERAHRSRPCGCRYPDPPPVPRCHPQPAQPLCGGGEITATRAARRSSPVTGPWRSGANPRRRVEKLWGNRLDGRRPIARSDPHRGGDRGWSGRSGWR
jgi:hypothetical protein